MPFEPNIARDFTQPPLTKVIATIGPASSSEEMIRKLVEAGVSIFRLNFSHGSLDEHAERVRTIRSVADELGSNTAVLGDLQGPKIRVGEVPEGGITVETGRRAIFQRTPILASFGEPGVVPARFSSTYPQLIDDVEPGQRLLINDGAVRMLIAEKNDEEIICHVTHGGLVTTGKGINLPDTDLSVEVLSDRDWKHVRWAIEHDLDFLALSFVRSADDVHLLQNGLDTMRAELDRTEMRMPIIAKIELPRAVKHAEAIIDAADGIMIARGDLGVEFDLARVPVVQKELLSISDRYGKPCIVATQMLETMIDSPTPTRAEASDVAGAIFDGTDAVMLSGETAVGKYPVVAVETMRRIAQYTEAHMATLPQKTSAPQKLIETRYRTAALAHGVWTIVQDIAAKLVVVWSQGGGGARYLSQNNFHVPIIAVTSDPRAARKMQLFRAVRPVQMRTPKSAAEFTRLMDAYLQESGLAQPNDVCVLVAGEPIGKAGVTNSLAIHAVGNPDTGYARHANKSTEQAKWVAY
jgi:pyruvate kinase